MITFDDSRLVVEIKKGHEKPVLLYYLSPDTSPDALLKLNSSPRDNNESTCIIVPGGLVWRFNYSNKRPTPRP